MKIRFQAVGYHQAPINEAFVFCYPKETEQEALKDAEELLTSKETLSSGCYVLIHKRYENE